MVGSRSFVVRGQLCAGVTAQGLVVRLGADGVARAREEAHVHPLIMGGKEAAAFAVIDPERYPTTSRWPAGSPAPWSLWMNSGGRG
jgi:hypothetical protein